MRKLIVLLSIFLVTTTAQAQSHDHGSADASPCNPEEYVESFGADFKIKEEFPQISSAIFRISRAKKGSFLPWSDR